MKLNLLFAALLTLIGGWSFAQNSVEIPVSVEYGKPPVMLPGPNNMTYKVSCSAPAYQEKTYHCSIAPGTQGPETHSLCDAARQLYSMYCRDGVNWCYSHWEHACFDNEGLRYSKEEFAHCL
jgi:hypothetical protein